MSPRSPGFDFNATVVIFDLEKQKSFNQGQMYVALSMVTNINNLYLIGKYNVNEIHLNWDTTTEYNRLQQQSKFGPGSNIDVDSPNLTIPLLNRRYLTKTDILCLTKSQIYANDDTNDVHE